MSIALIGRTDTNTRLQGRWLRWGRFGWLVTTLLALGVFIASIGETVRNEVNLNVLVERLITATEETLQPNHVSLWLRKGGNEG